MRRLACVWGLLVWLPMMAAMAAENEPTLEEQVDDRHRYLSGKALWVAEGINRFLMQSFRSEEDRESKLIQQFYGDRRSPYEVAGSHIRISPRATFSERTDHDYSVDYTARLRLGDLSERLTFFADSYDRDHDTLEEIFSDRYRKELDRERSDGATAGLTWFFSERARRDLSLTGGLRFRPAPSPRLRLRGRFRKSFDYWQMTAMQSVFWDDKDGFGERSQLNFGRSIGDIHLVRLSSSAIWSELSQGIDWGQFASYHAIFSRRRDIAVKAGARGHTHPSTVVDQYLVRVPYRQRVHRDWLFVVIEPGLDFFREDNYKIAPLIGLKLDIIIGSYDRLDP